MDQVSYKLINGFQRKSFLFWRKDLHSRPGRVKTDFESIQQNEKIKDNKWVQRKLYLF